MALFSFIFNHLELLYPEANLREGDSQILESFRHDYHYANLPYNCTTKGLSAQAFLEVIDHFVCNQTN